jgi:hypothetical protein
VAGCRAPPGAACQPVPVDRALAELRQLIDEHGWAVRHVGAGGDEDHSAFSYTVGLTRFEHPELVVVGMPFASSQTFLNLAGDLVREGRRFRAGTLTGDLTDGAQVAFLQVHDDSGLTAVEQVYGRVEALQLVWPDSQGRMPWDDGHANPPEAQPFLGPVPDTWELDDAPQG